MMTDTATETATGEVVIAVEGNSIGRPNTCAGCGGSGWVSVLMISARMREVYGDRATPTHVAYACVCPEGQKRVPQAIAIDDIATPEELRALFPQGLPERTVGFRTKLEHAGVGRSQSWYTLDTYTKEFGTDKDCARFAKYATEWAKGRRDDRPDLVLFGPNGTTKTGLAIALMRACIERGDAALFVSVYDLATRWRATFNEGATETTVDLSARLIDLDLLILDEVGGTALTTFVQDTITMIVNRRQQNARPTVLTFNVPTVDASGAPIDMDGVETYMVTMLGPTLYDRLRERAQFWPMVGASRRKVYKGPKFGGGAA